jgi:hypothetical protein
MKLIKLQEEHKDEYASLTKKEHDEIIEEFVSQRDETAKMKRPTAKA